MKKQKVFYHFHRYKGKEITARREISFEIMLASRLTLDALCFNYNKKKLQQAIDEAIDSGKENEFKKLSKIYRHYIWE